MEIALRIHTKGSESHEITTPEDMVSAEFILELIKGLRLPESDSQGNPILWEADDKDTGQTLIRERTLRENGVLEGHNLYLRQTVAPIPPPKLPVPVPVLDPAPPSNRGWLLWVALALIPVAGIAGYMSGGDRSAKVRADDQVEIANLQKQSAAAEAHAAQLQQDLDQLGHDVADKGATATKLQSELTAKEAEITALNQRIARFTTQIQTMIADSARKQSQITTLEASVQQLQPVQTQLAAAKQAEAALQQKILPLQQTVTSLQQQLQNERNRQRYGLLTWTGQVKKNVVVEVTVNRANVGMLEGTLPGMACTLQAADPKHVSILVRPGPENNWTRASFRVNGNGETTATLIWAFIK